MKRRDRQLLFKVAALYTVTHSDYFLDRALACLTRPRPLARIVQYFVRKLDDKFWFVYRQICLQINWLTFQSLGISDKSSNELLRSFMVATPKKERNEMIITAFETASDVKVLSKFRTTRYVHEKKNHSLEKALVDFFDWSETE
jgi:hypothetical protein